MRNLLRAAVLVPAVLAAACTSSARPASADGALPWPSASPASRGMDAGKIDQMIGWMRASNLEFHAVILLRGGALVREEYFPGWNRGSTQNVYSCTKSVLSALCGIAQGEGRLPAVDARALAFLPSGSPPAADPRAAEITLDQLLSMSAGLPFMRAVDMAGARDQTAFVLGKPLAQEPGARFLYTSGGPQVVSALLQRATGMSARDYAKGKLFQPLGIQDWSWDTDGTGVTIGATNLTLSAMDLARLGFLYLHGGAWFGTQVVPASWVKESTSLHARVTDMNRAEGSGYGYFWWVDEQWNGFSAHGAAGQFVFVVPRLDLVAVFTSGLSPDNFPVPWDLLKDYVLPACG